MDGLARIVGHDRDIGLRRGPEKSVIEGQVEREGLAVQRFERVVGLLERGTARRVAGRRGAAATARAAAIAAMPIQRPITRDVNAMLTQCSANSGGWSDGAAASLTILVANATAKHYAAGAVSPVDCAA